MNCGLLIRAGWERSLFTRKHWRFEGCAVLLVQFRPLAGLCPLRDLLSRVGLSTHSVLARFLKSRAISSITLGRPVLNLLLNRLLAIARIRMVAEPLRRVSAL